MHSYYHKRRIVQDNEGKTNRPYDAKDGQTTEKTGMTIHCLAERKARRFTFTTQLYHFIYRAPASSLQLKYKAYYTQNCHTVTLRKKRA